MKVAMPPGPVTPRLAVMLLQILPVRAPFDPLAYSIENARVYGDYVCTRFGALRVYQISDPDLARQVLVEKADKFHKADLLRQAIGEVVGNGLLTSEGDFWKRQRKLAQPAFHHKRIESYAESMVELTEQMLARWSPGQSMDVFHEMMKLTLSIVCRTLFSADVSADVDRVGGLVTTILEGANRRLSAFTSLADHMPAARAQRRKELEALAELNKIIMSMIAQHRAEKQDSGDLLSMLLMATDEDSGSGMTDQQLRDEVITLFLAGHETTANALAWTWYLLSQHPAVEAKLMDELATALGNRAPTMADLPNMPYTEMIIKESLRLYPPANGVTREPVEDTQIGDYTIPAGSVVTISSYVMHHNPRFFPDPESFDPERFSLEREANIPRYAYLPFGGGPRICIGNTFAMMEARLVLATIAQRFRLSLDPGQKVIAEQLFTLRPKYGILMTPAVHEHARATATA